MSSDPAMQANLEKEAAKTLKKLGFPPAEALASPVACISKVAQCLTRRLAKIAEYKTELAANVGKGGVLPKTLVLIEAKGGVYSESVGLEVYYRVLTWLKLKS
jgi:hypothetical protein